MSVLLLADILDQIICAPRFDDGFFVFVFKVLGVETTNMDVFDVFVVWVVALIDSRDYVFLS